MKYICIFIRLIILASLPLWVLAQESNTLELFQTLQSFSKESSLLILNELENPFAPIASTQNLNLYACMPSSIKKPLSTTNGICLMTR